MALMESLIAFKSAGAAAIFCYPALEVAEILQGINLKKSNDTMVFFNKKKQSMNKVIFSAD